MSVRAQEAGAVGVDPDVAQHGQISGQWLALSKRITWVGDRRAAEIQCVAIFIQYRLDDIRVAHRFFIVDRMAGCGDRTFGMGVQVFGNGMYQRGRNQRLIALHIHHDGVIRPASLFNHLGDTIRAAGMAVLGQAGLESMLMHYVGDCVMVGGDPYLLRAALCSLFGDPDHHGFAGDQQQRLAGQSCGRVACRNDDLKYNLNPFRPGQMAGYSTNRFFREGYFLHVKVLRLLRR